MRALFRFPPRADLSRLADPKRAPSLALGSYDAGEDNEISFKENDRITDIEEASPDWWTGTAPDGSRGLFPSAYVASDGQ